MSILIERELELMKTIYIIIKCFIHEYHRDKILTCFERWNNEVVVFWSEFLRDYPSFLRIAMLKNYNLGVCENYIMILI